MKDPFKTVHLVLVYFESAAGGLAIADMLELYWERAYYGITSNYDVAMVNRWTDRQDRLELDFM